MSKIFISFFYIFISSIIFSCGNLKTQNLGFKLKSPNLPKFSNYSTFTSFAPFHIPISITSNAGFSFTGTLQAGANTISLPVATSLTLTIGYLAIGLSGSQTLAQQCNSNNNQTTSVLYTELTQTLSIDETTSSIDINFPNPFTLVNFDHFGFKILDSSNANAANATVYLEDVISKSSIIDPCKKTPLSESVDSGGRYPTDIPIYSSSGQFRFRVVTTDGTTQIFTPTLPKGSSTAKFYFMQIGGAGTLTPMNESTDSFLDDEISIATRRDSLNRNPRYADIASYTFSPPDISSGMTSFYPNSQSNSNNRSFVAKCQITLSVSGTHGAIVYPFQTCNMNITNIFTDLTALTAGTSYFLDAYLLDSENFLASNTTAASPYTPIVTSTPYQYSFKVPLTYMK
ncbi:hypothetical protein [Fluviispira multicolorata]|uniref:Lipoprotein n=1 Tax=Fluviispira multicolorata TaxID=2654512 RepID=A0A833JHD5_9BACT|nr:hypothetical protein [Fluviispira multicolorata]KAB8033417.1 hypothetical protein GCL57_01570 [Fluviispira multicolorata]